MRRLLIVPAFVLSLLIAIATAAVAFQSHAGSFTDDDGSVHEADIEAIAAEEITRGCNPPARDRFCPGDSVSRGEMAAFLDRARNLPSSSTDHFIDDNDSIFEPSINSLAESEITRGCNPPTRDRFCPDEPVSRGEMAAFLVRAFEYPADSTDHFIDDDNSIFEDDIQALRRAGVTKGCNPPDNNEFCPNDPVSRAEMGTFLARALHLSAADPTPFGNRTCDPAYFPCVPTVEEFGDLNCSDITEHYPDGVRNDLSIGDPHGLNTDGDDRACEPTSGGGSGGGGGSGHATFGEGQHLVGSDIQAGRYRTRTASSSCYWERQSDTSGDFDAIIANEFTDHVTVVDIAGSDAAFETSNCATWTDDLSAITNSQTADFGPGTYIVGTDVAATQWRAPGGDSCYWERLADFSGENDAIKANSFGTTNPVVTISSTDAGFNSSNCGVWTRV